MSPCSACKTNCCRDIPGLRPILMPWKKPATPTPILKRAGRLVLIKRRADGACVYFEDGRCLQYHRRPLECQLYPLVLTMSSDGLRLCLDLRATCKTGPFTEAWLRNTRRCEDNMLGRTITVDRLLADALSEEAPSEDGLDDLREHGWTASSPAPGASGVLMLKPLPGPLADLRCKARAGILRPGILVAAEEEDVVSLVKDLGLAVVVV